VGCEHVRKHAKKKKQGLIEEGKKTEWTPFDFFSFGRGKLY